MAGLFNCGKSTREAWARDTNGSTWLGRTIGPYRDDVTREEIDAALDHDLITKRGVVEFWSGWDAAGSQRPNALPKGITPGMPLPTDVSNQAPAPRAMATMDQIKQLQQQLADIEKRFEPLRKNRSRTPEWEREWNDIIKAAAPVHAELWELTGNAYGHSKKAKPPRPDDDLLCARYDSPEDVPAEVMQWVRRNNSITTSDATDAVRWARIVDTQGDDRYPSGEITLYRAIELGDHIVDEIRPGDWVTDSLEYAQSHLSRYFNGKGSILEMDVDGCDVLVSPTGNHEEAIYAPMHLSGPIERSPVVREREK